MLKAKSTSHLQTDRFFLLGFGLFFLGLIGGFVWLHQNQQKQINHLVSNQALAVVELKLNRQNLKFLQTKLNTTPTSSLLIPGLSAHLTWGDFSNWVGSYAGLSWLPKQQFFHTFSFRKRTEAQKFINSFLLPSETLAERQSSYGTIYTPAYSSNHAFLFYKGQLMWADTPTTLVRELDSNEKLYQYSPYKSLKQDLPRLKFINTYLNFAGDTSQLSTNSKTPAYASILKGLGTSTPQWGFSLKIKDNTLRGDIKIATHQGVFDANQVIAKAANKTIPDLAYFAPKNTLFFQNGHDLYTRYQHTKKYLKELDPQLSLVFEGLIRAQAETWFGTDFDFETDFLQLIRGPYAFILDFNQGLEIGFISSLGAGQDPENIHQLIQKAQSRFTPVIESIELPDGTQRQELVATDPLNIPIQKNEILGQTYYTSHQDDGRINFSYSQIGNYLVMTNRAKLVQKIITTHADSTKSLAANNDFRNSVMFDFKTAEVYGFLNAPKLAQLNLYWKETHSQTPLLNFNLTRSLRNLTFSKQVLPEAIFMKLRLFFN